MFSFADFKNEVGTARAVIARKVDLRNFTADLLIRLEFNADV